MRLLSTIFLALLGIVPMAAHAQTPVALEGLQVITERQYAMDPDKPIDTGGDGIFLATARVYQFDNEAHADPVYDSLVEAEGVTSQLPADNSATLETTTLDDIGTRATVLNLKTDLGGGDEGYFRMAIVQDEGIIVTVTIIAGSEDAAGAAEIIATAMVEREPGTSPSVYEGNGKSTGGVWEMYLPADADELQGLQAYMDKETRPAS